ncbi:MAG: isochorismatase family cysteine hydrolase [Rubrivivax sp.]
MASAASAADEGSNGEASPAARPARSRRIAEPRLAPSPVVLLLVDFINPLRFDGAEYLAPRAAAALACARLRRRGAAAACRRSTPTTTTASGVPTSPISGGAVAAARSGAPGVLARTLRPLAGDCTLLKPRHSAFHGTALDLLLRQLARKRLIVTGLATCVLFTAMDAYLRGYELWVPEDCTAAETTEDHRAALAQMNRVLKAHARRGVNRDAGRWGCSGSGSALRQPQGRLAAMPGRRPSPACSPPCPGGSRPCRAGSRPSRPAGAHAGRSPPSHRGCPSCWRRAGSMEVVPPVVPLIGPIGGRLAPPGTAGVLAGKPGRVGGGPGAAGARQRPRRWRAAGGGSVAWRAAGGGGRRRGGDGRDSRDSRAAWRGPVRACPTLSAIYDNATAATASNGMRE